MKRPILLSLGLVLSGCFLQPPTPEEIAARPFNSFEEPAVVCRKEKPTGSNRVVMVCREVPNAEDQLQTKRTMQRLKRQSEVYAENR
jgi:hypothetical protein